MRSKIDRFGFPSTLSDPSCPIRLSKVSSCDVFPGSKRWTIRERGRYRMTWQGRTVSIAAPRTTTNLPAEATGTRPDGLSLTLSQAYGMASKVRRYLSADAPGPADRSPRTRQDDILTERIQETSNPPTVPRMVILRSNRTGSTDNRSAKPTLLPVSSRPVLAVFQDDADRYI